MKKLRNTIIITSICLMLTGCGGELDANSAVGIESYKSDVSYNNSSGYNYDSYSNSEYGSYTEDDYSYDTEEYNINNYEDTTDNSVTHDEVSQEQVSLSSEKLIYSSDIRLETTDFEVTTSNLKNLVTRYEVIIENENYSNSNYGWYREDYTVTASRNASYNLRVPSNNYNDFVESLDDLGNITYKTSDVQNMSSVYRDNEARLETLNAKRDRLVELMEQTGTITEIIQVEDSLEQVDYQIEQLKLSQQNIDLGVAYSYVNISLEEVGEYTKIQEKKITFSEELKNAFRDSWDALVHILRVAVISLAQLSIVLIIPFILFVIILVLIIRFIIKKSNNKRNKALLKNKVNLNDKNSKDNNLGDKKDEQSK